VIVLVATVTSNKEAFSPIYEPTPRLSRLIIEVITRALNLEYALCEESHIAYGFGVRL
jgi:hypothetical protein